MGVRAASMRLYIMKTVYHTLARSINADVSYRRSMTVEGPSAKVVFFVSACALPLRVFFLHLSKTMFLVQNVRFSPDAWKNSQDVFLYDLQPCISGARFEHLLSNT